MPRPKVKVCNQPGCPELAPPGKPNCQSHTPTPWASRETREPLPSNWRALRAAVLERDNHTCHAPGCRTKATHVDHITPRSLGGSHHMTNLQALCRSCHATKSAIEGNAARRDR